MDSNLTIESVKTGLKKLEKELTFNFKTLGNPSDLEFLTKTPYFTTDTIFKIAPKDLLKTQSQLNDFVEYVLKHQIVDFKETSYFSIINELLHIAKSSTIENINTENIFYLKHTKNPILRRTSIYFYPNQNSLEDEGQKGLEHISLKKIPHLSIPTYKCGESRLKLLNIR